MPESKKDTWTDLAKLDAHEIRPEEYEDIPELTDADLDRADLYFGKKLLRRGRPRVANPKVMVSLRVDAELAVAMKGSGKGWMTVAGEVLKAHFLRGK